MSNGTAAAMAGVKNMSATYWYFSFSIQSAQLMFIM